MINDIIILRENVSGIWEELIFSSQANYVLGFDGTGLPVSKPMTTAANVALLDAAAQEFTGTNVFKGASAQTQLIDGFFRGYAFGLSPSLSHYRANGTLGTPTAVALGNLIGNFNARGYGLTGYKGAEPDARITFIATEAFTDTAHGCRCVIEVTPNGSIIRAVAAAFDQDLSFQPQGDTYLLANKAQHVIDGTTAGVEDLVAGTVTIPTARVDSSDRILLFRVNENGSTGIGHLVPKNIVDGVSFDILSLKSDLSDETGDVSSVYWVLVKTS